MFDKILDSDPKTFRNLLDARYGAMLERVLSGEPAVLYPAARMAQEACAALRKCGATIAAFGDARPELYSLDIPVLSAEAIAESYRTSPIMVCSTLHESAITRQLRSLGCSSLLPVGYLVNRLPDCFVNREYGGCFDSVFEDRDDIRRVFGLLADDASRRTLVAKLRLYLTFEEGPLEDVRREPIYFGSDVVSLSEHEVFVDGGAFNGDTFQQFRSLTGNKFRRYYAFEPDPTNLERLRLATAGDARVTCVAAGLSDRQETLAFEGVGGFSSRISESGELAARVVPLDDYLAERPTFIKLDIEGYERQALRGSCRIIAESAPTLAISAYHFPRDLWQIPLLIHGLDASYRIMLRHHTRDIDDTVCYAVKK